MNFDVIKSLINGPTIGFTNFCKNAFCSRLSLKIHQKSCFKRSRVVRRYRPLQKAFRKVMSIVYRDDKR